MRIAFVGAYGNGKTTLTTELSEKLGLARTHGSAMRDPAGGTPKALEETNEPELVQLAVRRFTERAVEEAAHPEGFLSDGSVLHEWVYSKVRLAVGRFPEPTDTLAGAVREPRTLLFEEVVDQLGLLAKEHARTGYDVFVHCPVEFPLPQGVDPISESFRTLSDELMLDILKTLDIPVHVVTGTVEERLDQILAIPGVSGHA
ncbi:MULTISPECIES: AAA family ATPase [unclassified Streptomyces]|uniref:AAA family ATPase n=1 Tax=unclassified Streptomyces TaxID=2593676 RepID=UPI000DB92D41|nr:MULTISPECIES: AAA family ATPase [unclassified Streptomyces]MYT75216.1 AAA family ATPase [Streptomyces sp. SID8367]RAJ77172.1 AAA domain-containing protein [Streptomyces sp. PsTaAH-137]